MQMQAEDLAQQERLDKIKRNRLEAELKRQEFLALQEA
jgi:hypothetical protein